MARHEQLDHVDDALQFLVFHARQQPFSYGRKLVTVVAKYFNLIKKGLRELLVVAAPALGVGVLARRRKLLVELVDECEDLDADLLRSQGGQQQVKLGIG